jgi:phosphomannomutase
VTTIRFGTDGWRAVIADDFTTANVAKVAQAHAQFLKKQAKSPRVVIGYDTRFAGRLFAQKTAQVMAVNGVEVFLIQQFVPTPVLSHAVVNLAATGGVMITASHNPAQYNGYKIKGAYGGSATPRIVQAIEQELEQLEPILAFQTDQYPIHAHDPDEAYFRSISALLDLEVLRGYKGNFYHDSMGGSGATYIQRFMQFTNLPVQVKPLRFQPDPLFYGVNPEPIAQNAIELTALMKLETNGFAVLTDGDADRVGAVLSGGQLFNSHQIFCVLLCHLYNKGLRGKVVKTFSSTQLIELLCKTRNLEVVETPIGFKYITDAMLESQVLLGGEESGGFGVQGHLPERDGILNSLLLLEAVAMQGLDLAQIFAEIEKEVGLTHAYDRIDLYLKNPLGVQELRQSFESQTVFAGQGIVTKQFLDGVKLILEDSAWLLFRASGTEPVLRIYAEAQDQPRLQALLEAATVFISNTFEVL